MERNKIFFETAAAVLLAFMAVWLSYQANQIASNQLQIAKQENFPIMHFDIDLDIGYIHGTSELDYIHDRLNIYNVGPALSEFRCECIVFFEIRYGEVGKEPRPARIPFLEYYGSIDQTNAPMGKLITFEEFGIGFISSEDNYLKTNRAIIEFFKFAEERNAHGSAYVMRYIRIQYKDIWGEEHEEFYFIDEFGSHRMSNEEGEEVLAEYRSKCKIGLPIWLSHISGELLYEKWLVMVVENESISVERDRKSSGLLN